MNDKSILQEKPCKECGKTFKPKRPWQEFHSVKCRNDYWHSYYSSLELGSKKPILVNKK